MGHEDTNLWMGRNNRGKIIKGDEAKRNTMIDFTTETKKPNKWFVLGLKMSEFDTLICHIVYLILAFDPVFVCAYFWGLQDFNVCS